MDHAPIIYMDRKEPFGIKKVGVHVYTEDGCRSISFNRKFDFKDFAGTCKVLEYAYYLDYDIQHLYDLEHIWIYLDAEGKQVGAEGSYHGRFLNANGVDLGSRIIMYSQPGKHAMLASPEYMKLYTQLYASCGRLAGISGLDAPEQYLTYIRLSEKENARVAEYIKANFSFVPSMEFEPVEIPAEDYMTWEELAKSIPGFIKAQLAVIFK